jgi:hypothetical protein
MNLPMREDANEGTPVDLSAILKLVQERDEAAIAVEEAEQHLKDVKKHFDKMDQDIIPDALRELGLTEVSLEDGRKVGYKEKYKAHISEERRAAAMADIRQRGFANIIDNTITLKFTAKQTEMADAAKELLEKGGYSFSQKQAVHNSRLCSWVTERVESGDDIPLELYGAHVVTKTSIKAKRK